jgi:hypothetical protein
MRLRFLKAALLTPLLGLGVVCGSELKGTPEVPQPAVKPLPPPAPPDKKADGATCSTFGTSVEFEDSPSDAAKKAKKQEKLVFVLHVSGNFEDPRFT